MVFHGCKMQGSEPTDSVWCLSALCFCTKLSPKLNSEANYERVKCFFNCTSHKMHGLRISKEQEASCGIT